jgi:hypothetical protein
MNDALRIILAVGVSVIVNGVLFIFLVRDKGDAKKPDGNLGENLIERLESDNLQTGLSALAELVYKLSERHGGIYITSARVDGYDDTTATAKVEADFITSWFRGGEQ